MGYRFQFSVVFDNLGYLLQGTLLTLSISTFGIAVGLVIAAAVATMRMSRLAPLRTIATVYVEVFRATPLLCQLYIIFFALPSILLKLDSLQAGLVALSLYSGAYCTEILRAGLESVPKGQVSAAQSLGFTGWQTFRYVILPQALRKIMPPLGNQFIDTTLSSSVLAVIGTEELTMHATLLDSRYFRPFEVYAAVGLTYFLLTQILVRLFSKITDMIGAGRRVPALAGDITLVLATDQKGQS